jgi:hypothetical protein
VLFQPLQRAEPVHFALEPIVSTWSKDIKQRTSLSHGTARGWKRFWWLASVTPLAKKKKVASQRDVSYILLGV